MRSQPVSQPHTFWQQPACDTEGLDDALIDQLIEERNASRKAKNFARADEIRDQLQAMGISLEDVADGTRWRRSDS